MMIVGLSVLTFIISLFGVFWVRQQAGTKLIDVPNERSSHTRPTPRGGGVGFVVAFALTSGLWFLLSRNHTVCSPVFWLILLQLIGIGIWDDRFRVPVKTRYLVQLSVAIALIIYFGVFPFPGLENIDGIWTIIPFVLTIIGLTAMINFYNFMDGIDGLVAGVSAVQLGFLAVWFQQPEWWLLVAALLGFLYWNWSPAKIFMGDAGSTFLGCIVMTAFLAYNGDILQHWVALVITFPLTIDAIYTIIRRLIRYENIFKAHRTHLYQRLHQAGWSHAQVTSAYVLLTLILGLLINWFSATGALLGTLIVVASIAIGELYLAFNWNRPKNLSEQRSDK
ncbi:MAG: glycosyltransferase family 4 protein [SAR324 cluster bacterium]|nr:glycosyltransferase family 4 protein [SAR324 cluster bacterium]